MNNELNVVVVYNFVDMLSHARTDMQMIRELASDDAAYRSLNAYPGLSILRCFELLKVPGAKAGARVIITTDHGTIRVKKPK